jgi:hypothetical protein
MVLVDTGGSPYKIEPTLADFINESKVRVKFHSGKTTRKIKDRISENKKNYGMYNSKVFLFTKLNRSNGYEENYNEQIVLNTTQLVANRLLKKKYVNINWKSVSNKTFDKKDGRMYPKSHDTPPTKKININLLENVVNSIEIQSKILFESVVKMFPDAKSVDKDKLKKVYTDIIDKKEFEHIKWEYNLHKTIRTQFSDKKCYEHSE